MREHPRARQVAATLASIGFLVFIIGVTYFAILVVSARYGPEEQRFTAYRELGLFLSGETSEYKWAWYKDARVYGAVALLFALSSLLFGVHKLARITIPTAGLLYAFLNVWGDEFRTVLERWALGP